MARKIHCPQCGKDTLYHPDNIYRPFCSERCRLIDLGQWAEEKYRLPDETAPLDHDSFI
ncbi:MAG: DNA gyrase inhibitor YacG [Formivibrio sp.]|nr:DNA gyrase inhibitor YacG [Formivibrio sp.]